VAQLDNINVTAKRDKRGTGLDRVFWVIAVAVNGYDDMKERKKKHILV
jgi:hypothetical protein